MRWAARELDLAGIANQSWQGRHLVNTRGCGLEMAPVSRVTSTDRPDYQSVELERPELYFSPALEGYAIARTDEAENGCGDNEPYEGLAGVQMSSFLRRAAFAVAFLDYNVVGSGAVNDDSEMLWVRSVRDRVVKLAPFLAYDGDPYPVIVDGTVQWVIDAYTATTRYPYSQRIGEVELTDDVLRTDANYVRNSVKAVVDAYTGEVTFYVVDEEDPILRAWRSAFPDLFTPLAAMPAELKEHLRYPEDLFRVQTDVYSKYQIPPENFFQRVGAWSVAQAPAQGPRVTVTAPEGATAAAETAAPSEFATESDAERFIPYYTLFRNPAGEVEFSILRPFVPFSRDDQRTELQAFMTASSEPATYGRLTSYVVQGDLPDGPVRVTSQAESEPAISREISLQDNAASGRRVRFGDLQLVPVSDGLVYVRPFYVEVERPGPIPLVTEYRFVITSYNEQATYAPSLSEALALLFPGFDADVGDRVVRRGTSGDPQTSDGTEEPDPGEEEPEEPVEPETSLPDDATPEELLAAADELFVQAEEELRATGDLGAYQDTVQEASDLVARALELLETGG